MEPGLGEPPWLPPSEEPDLILFLRQYGYSAVDAANWRLAPGVGWEESGPSAVPEKNRLFHHHLRSGNLQSMTTTTVLSMGVVGHEEREGHTCYAIACSLSIRSSRMLEWQVWRRLSQVREGMHDRVKAELGPVVYTRYFKDARFAPKGGLPGTTSKLSSWCSVLAHVINEGSALPRLTCHVLRFLGAPEAPLPTPCMAAPASPTNTPAAGSGADAEPGPMLVGPAQSAPCAGVGGNPAGRPSTKCFSRKLPSLGIGGHAHQKRRLVDVTEQKVVRAGLARLAVALPGGAEEKLSSFVLRDSFFNDLLSGGLDLNRALDFDISASGGDLKHLSLPQQLALRARTLGIDTDYSSSSAQTCFLNTLDSQIFEGFARWCLAADTTTRRGDVFDLRCYADSRMMNRLGFQLVLIHGAMALFAEGCDKSSGHAAGFLPPQIPSSWAVVLDKEGWPDCRAALFFTAELRLQVLPGETPDFAAELTPGGRLAVAMERSGTTGIEPVTLDWEVSILDPVAAEDDLRSMLQQKSEAKAGAKLVTNVAAVLERRGTTSIQIVAHAGA